nr:hypothetical protein [Allokutzneria albata]
MDRSHAPDRIDGPNGTTGIPSPSIQSRKSWETHTRTSRPSSRNRNANATTGCASPRDPIAASTTPMVQLLVPA